MTKRLICAFVLVAGATLLIPPVAPPSAGCVELQGENGLPPAPTATKSELLTTELYAFTIDKDKDAYVARYTLSLTPAKPLSKELFLEIRFENPLDKEKPIVVQQSLKPGEERTMAVSENLTSLKCGLYKAEVVIYDSAAREKSLGTHTQMILSTHDLSKIKKPKDLEALSKC